jgi:hypothetical protein
MADDSVEKDMRIARDSVSFVSYVASHGLDGKYCFGFIKPNAVSSNLGFHIDATSGKFIQNEGENGSHVKASGSICIFKNTTAIPVEPDALYNVELNQVPHRSRSETSQWSPYLVDGGLALLLQDPSTIKGTLDYFPQSLLILPNWFEVINKVRDNQNVVDILKNPNLENNSTFALSLKIFEDTLQSSGPKGLKIRDSYKQFVGLDRTIIVSAIFDALPASDKILWNNELAKNEASSSNKDDLSYWDFLGIEASNSYSRYSKEEKEKLISPWKITSSQISAPPRLEKLLQQK